MTADLSGLPGADRGGTLEGVVVLELAQSFAAELAGGLLADLGRDGHQDRAPRRLTAPASRSGYRR